MQRLREAFGKALRRVTIFSRFDPYWNEGRTAVEEKSFRHPAPLNQEPANIPDTLQKHEFDTMYHKRGTNRTTLLSALQDGVNIDPRLSPAEQAAERYKILPLHLPRPAWWDRQHEIVERADKLGLPVPPGEYVRPVLKRVPNVWAQKK